MHILITAGPTREYLDDVRFLSNASSGRMGYALAESCVRRGWQVTLVSGPVSLAAPAGVAVVNVMSAREMLDACLHRLPGVDGVIAVAAVADFRPVERFAGKLRRTREPLSIELVPNPDILAEIGRRKTKQASHAKTSEVSETSEVLSNSCPWTIGFAVESGDSAEALARAREKLRSKHCDAIVVNSSRVMEAADTAIQLLDRAGAIALESRGTKASVADQITAWIAANL